MVLVTQKPKPQPVHEQKRHGRHHRSEKKHYSKTYWPYLPLLTIVVVGLAISSFWNKRTDVLSVTTDITAIRLLQETNQARVDYNKPALALNSQLSAAATAKATDMAKRDYWAHTTPDGKQPWVFIKDAGYHYVAVSENLAYGFTTSDDTVNGWMNSPSHRENLLDKTYSEVGFGVAESANYQGKGAETIIVAMYGAPDLSMAAQAGNFRINDTQGYKEDAAQDGRTNGQVLPAREVSRLEATMNTGPWGVILVAVVAGISMVIFTFKHGLLWRRVATKGEVFIVKYHLLDITLISVGILGYIATRGAGNIQ